jgi:hypothetical protein
MCSVACLVPEDHQARVTTAALATIATWSREYGRAHGGVTPDPDDLMGEEFMDRVGPEWGADKAAANAARYPGGRAGALLVGCGLFCP